MEEIIKNKSTKELINFLLLNKRRTGISSLLQTVAIEMLYRCIFKKNKK